jgi:predicted nucleic acid-binding protein
VRYWDASVLVALCVEEAATERARALAPGGIVTWAGSRVEIASAIERGARTGHLGASERQQALGALAELARAWVEIDSIAAVCDRAIRLLAVHPLRAADSMQLAAAMVAVSDRPPGHDFVCSDHRLREAAAREGFVLAL